MERALKGFIIPSYLAAIIVLMDLTAVNIALPTIKASLNLTASDVSWLLLISMLTSSGFALVAGRIVEIVQPRRLMLIAFSFFGLCNILSFLFADFYALLTIRFFQGFAHAIIYVIGPALIRHHLHGEQRTHSYGMWMMFTGVGIATGPLLGGFLVDYLGWEYVFLINVPLCIAALVFVLRMPATSNTPSENSNGIVVGGYSEGALDIKGSVYSFVFLASLLLGLNSLAKENQQPLIIGLCFVTSIIFVLLYIRNSKQVSNPVFSAKLFNLRNFTLANIGFFLYFLVNVGSRFLRPFFFEDERLLSPHVSGILMMISPLVMIMVAPLIKRLSRMLPIRTIVISGNVVLMASMVLFSLWTSSTSIEVLVGSMVLLGIGMGLYYPSNSVVGMNALPEGRHGMGSAALSTSKSLGKLMGVLVFAFVFSSLLSYSHTFLLGAGVALFAILLSFFIRSEQ